MDVIKLLLLLLIFSFLLPKIEICLKYFLDKNFHKVAIVRM